MAISTCGNDSYTETDLSEFAERAMPKYLQLAAENLPKCFAYYSSELELYNKALAIKYGSVEAGREAERALIKANMTRAQDELFSIAGI